MNLADAMDEVARLKAENERLKESIKILQETLLERS